MNMKHFIKLLTESPVSILVFYPRVTILQGAGNHCGLPIYYEAALTYSVRNQKSGDALIVKRSFCGVCDNNHAPVVT